MPSFENATAIPTLQELYPSAFRSKSRKPDAFTAAALCGGAFGLSFVLAYLLIESLT